MAAAAGFGAAAAEAGEGPILAFSNRAHFFAPPKVKDKLIWCFRDVLGAGEPAVLNAPGLPVPILAFRFPGSGSISVELTEGTGRFSIAPRDAAPSAVKLHRAAAEW